MKESRLRGQRISRTELIRESRETLQRFGVGNHSRAAFIRKISSEVVGSTEPIFVQLQPKLLPHDTDAWANAFSVVFEFLKRNKMTLTLETVEVEAGDEVKGQRTKFYLPTLVSQQPPPVSFTERVLQSQFGDGQFANPILKEPPSPRQSPKHLIDFSVLPKRSPASPVPSGKPDFTTPIDEGGSLSDEGFSSDFHIDDVISPRK
jgi:hypothetical protein